jgi:competence protein ComEA
VTPGAPAAAMVDINTADQVALETIPGIGPVKAAAILQFRTESGSFASVEQLLEVTGIGPATLEAIRPYVTL